jgi:hypothetical protein
MQIIKTNYATFKANEISRMMSVIEDGKFNLDLQLESGGEIDIHELEEDLEYDLEYDILMNSYKMFNSIEDYETFFNDILEYDESDYDEEGFLYVDHNKFIEKYDLEWHGMNLATILINGEYYAHYEHNGGDGVLRYTKSKREFVKMLNEIIDNYWQSALEAFRQENEDEKEFRES